MANLNRVLLIGNCTRDVVIRYTPNGTAIADFGIAVNRVWRNDAGEKQEEVTFVDVQFWSRLAEIAQEYLHKGHQFSSRVDLNSRPGTIGRPVRNEASCE